MAHTHNDRSISRRIPGVIGALALLGLGAGFAAQPSKLGDKPARTDAKGFAMVELYTSEGCSSCPPADAALAALHARATKDATPVYTLSFHVDYWNNLGWPDRFSTPGNTERQHRYAKAFRANSVYTPQAIVNGSAEFVGADTSRLDTEVKGALAKPATASVKLTQSPWQADQAIGLRAEIEHAPAGALLCAALCEDGLSNDVKAGENRGRVLAHDSVVRDFQVSKIGDDGVVRVSLTPPKDLKASKASIVVFVQDAETMKVLGATGAALKAEPEAKAPKATTKAPATPK